MSAVVIVDTEVLRQAPDRTLIPWYVVDAVVEAPFGSHPGEMSGMSVRDEDHIRSYYESTKDPEKVKAYLDKWVYGVESHESYLDLVGREHLETLRIKGA